MYVCVCVFKIISKKIKAYVIFLFKQRIYSQKKYLSVYSNRFTSGNLCCIFSRNYLQSVLKIVELYRKLSDEDFMDFIRIWLPV